MAGEATRDGGRGEDPTERTIRSLETLHVEHYRGLSRAARVTASCTAVLGNPLSVAVALALIAGWLAFNGLGPAMGLKPFDPHPFAILELIATLFAVVTTLLILATQRRDDRLSQRRLQLTLQMAALSEQKIAKVIALLEEQRRESPHLPDRADQEAEALAKASDPKDVLDRIEEAHETGEEKG